MKIRGTHVQGHHWLSSEFQVSVSYRRPLSHVLIACCNTPRQVVICNPFVLRDRIYVHQCFVLLCCFGSVNIYYFSNVKICGINSRVKDRKGLHEGALAICQEHSIKSYSRTLQSGGYVKRSRLVDIRIRNTESQVHQKGWVGCERRRCGLQH